MVPTVATEVLSELQATTLLTSWLDPSLKVAVAENCFCAPIGNVMEVGVRDTDVTSALLTLKGTVELVLPRVAITLTSPGTKPFPIPLLEPIESMVGSDDVHTTV